MAIHGNKLANPIATPRDRRSAFSRIDITIEVELRRELEFLSGHRRAVAAMTDVVDLPDRKRDLFIRLCFENGGRLSARKRRSHFDSLTDAEVADLEAVVSGAFRAAEHRGR